MFTETEDEHRPAGANRKAYLRSVSWTDRSPRAPNPKPQRTGKGRMCLPSLPPLSISRPNCEDWPTAGSDDLGIWPLAPTPGGQTVTKGISDNKQLDPQPLREFQYKREKLAFFDKECSRIMDHVYLGSDAVARNREILRQNGITHVLNCVGFVCPEYFKTELVYKTLWLQDSPSEDITSILYDVFDYFEDVREQNGRVLVHCCQGVSRSTSLVIAYLMLKERRTFEDAFQIVKAARGVTNPNMGFACQLLLCQKRILDFLASPKSMTAVYRMAPHSPYAPLHLVPKMLISSDVAGLDSRGAFLVRVPSVVFVWIGKHCPAVMSDNAKLAAFQVVKYEIAKGPVFTVKEGEETPEFWDAIGYEKTLSDGNGDAGKRKVEEYNKDFEIFHQAVSGGILPPIPLSGTETETCLPFRDSGWGRLRRKFASGIMKKLLASTKLDSCEVDDHPSVSPSTSDYSSSLTFSPSSSNWSDLSYLSSQSSPSGTDCPVCKGFLETNICLACKKSYRPPLMILPSVDELTSHSHLPRLLVRSRSFSLAEEGYDMLANNDEMEYDMEKVVYKWPSFDRVDMGGFALLDSSLVYLAIVPSCNTLFIWVGSEYSTTNLKDDWEMVGYEFLNRRGFPSSRIKIIKEGEEDADEMEEFLKHLS
ncbi:protein-tyrosine-phosphatase MKP1-like [Impatiens glandulifera]|uniref:protein-tyrosine-phosphatase MKP1-like n=1 Tax=Impatiens glandulifera TaxID=253017 RepID=UPI001FB16389|nr:protein-tyrosine-phosphatase MKP1-like [Impatiens glandulifera]